MRLNQVTVPSRDVARASLFYQKLGLQLIVENLPTYVRLACPGEDGATLSVHLEAQALEGAGAIIYFECDNLDARVAELAAAGLLFERAPLTESWLWREAHLRDPDGNRLRLYHAGTNRLDPPWRVDSHRQATL